MTRIYSVQSVPQVESLLMVLSEGALRIPWRKRRLGMGNGIQSAQSGVSISQAPNHYALSKEQQLSTTDTASSKFLSYPASTESELPSCDLGQ